MIAVLVGQAYEYYQASFIQGMVRELFACDCDVCVFSTYEKYQNTAAREIGETSIFKLIPYDRFDGFVLMLDTLQTHGLCDSIMAEIRKKVKVPVITVDKKVDDYICVNPRDYDGIKTIISHLIEEHGYTDIAFLTGKSWHPYSKERLKAFMDCMDDHGLTVKDDRVFFGDFWYTSGENLGEKLVKMSGSLPQAVACANDCMAVGLAKSLTDHGLRIPEDIAVVGYDSNDEGRCAPKPITSVTLPAESLGVHAGKMIIALMDGTGLPVFDEPVDMFIGFSCGCTNEQATYVSRLRDTWNTSLSTNNVYSPYNHMDEDLLSQSSFYGLMNTIFSYTYQIRHFAGFDLCLSKDWQHVDERVNRSNEPFSDRMMHALYCGPENAGEDKIGVDDYFDRNELLPRLFDQREKPAVFFFTPIYFEDMAYGYAAISFDEPRSYSEEYRIWLRCIMRGLEYFKRQEQLRVMNAALEANMVRDPLTGFHNYKGFQKQSGEILAKLKNSDPDALVSMTAIDVRNLSGINSDYGRAAGDNAIVCVSESLRKVAGEDSFIFAMGNGEFVVAASASSADETNNEGAEEIIRKLKEELTKINVDYDLEISYGYSIASPETRNDFERLAGAAINNKNIRKHNLSKIEESKTLSEEEQEEAKVVDDILEHNKLNYHFQPIVEAKTGNIYAYEALMRADVVPYMAPPVVLRYAEFFNRLYDVEKATFNNVLDIIAKGRDKFAPGSKVFINSIPGHVLKDEDFAEVIKKLDKNTSSIVVEFTEQSEIRETEMARIKKRYEDAGLQTAVDDYGTGYSNVSNLLAYMPNYVKIDRMLLTDIHNSPQKQHFVKDIISFSHENGIMALAEGVETIEEYRTVLELGADLVQGYFVARPSANIIKEIDPEIKEMILESANEVDYLVNKDTYTAGREGRISLPVLIEEGYKKIVIPNGQVAYRDITISGAPGLVSELYVIVEDGYQGTIAFENVGFSGKMTGNSITIGEKCDVFLEFSGENMLDGGGIRVPPTSRVIFTGDGYVKINVQKLEAYGIGNALASEHGDIIFDQDGTFDITINSAQGIAIGSGQGGEIHINRGRFIISMDGQSGIGIGAILGKTQPVISNCDVTITNRALRCVGIGSVEGDCDISIDKLSLICVLHGNEGIALGCISGSKCNVVINSGSVKIDAEVNDFMGVGSHMASDTFIKLNHMSLNCNFSGSSSAFVGSFREGAKISISSCCVSAKGTTGYGYDFAASEENINLKNSKCEVMINDRIMTRDG